jgi:hypothetical protein
MQLQTMSKKQEPYIDSNLFVSDEESKAMLVAEAFLEVDEPAVLTKEEPYYRYSCGHISVVMDLRGLEEVTNALELLKVAIEDLENVQE